MTRLTDFDKSVPLLIVRLGRYPIHHGSVGVARSLGRLGVPVYAIVEDGFTPLALSRYVTGWYRWQSRNPTRESVLNDLGHIAGKLGRRALLLPTDDVASVFLAENQSELRSPFILPCLSPGLPRRLCHKGELYRLCKSAGVPCAETAFPFSIEDVHDFIETADFPVMVKAAESRLLPKGASSTAIARNPAELLDIYQRSETPGIANLLLQEYIPLGSEDWIYHGYRNAQNGCTVSFSGVKLRSWPPYAGPTSLGVCRQNQTLIAQTEALMRTIGYAGISDLDYRLDKRDGLYKLLDFNPRVGANFRMFEDTAGLDVVRAMYLDLTGHKVQQAAPGEGHRLVVESFDFFASLGYMRHGALTVSEWWESLKGNREMAWFHADDPIPFFAMAARLTGRTIARAFGRTAPPAQSPESSTQPASQTQS